MSSDNGIYLLKMKDGYRVAHLQAIDNIYWHPTCCDNPNIKEQDLPDEGFGGDLAYHDKCENCGTIDPEWEQKEEINPAVIMSYFGNCKVFYSEEEAFKEADRIYTEITTDDLCGIVEYGISKINGLEEFPFPTKE